MIRLVLPYPISANRYWASRVIRAKATGKWMALTYVTPEAKAYKEDVAKIAHAAGLGSPVLGRVASVIELYPHRPLDWKTRQRKLGAAWDNTVQCIDLGNCEKVLSDALQDIVFGDDMWQWDIHLKRKEPDEHGARVVVTITPIHVEQPQSALELTP